MKGQATLEIIIALGLITIVFASIILVISTNQSLSLDSGESNQAVALARENLEITRAMAKSNFSGIKNSSSAQNEFLKEIVVQDINNFTKQVTSRVSWQTDPLRIQEVELPTIITDPETVKNLGGDTGGGGLSGDWKNPRTLGSVDLGPGNSATGLDVVNKIVYLSALASDSKKPDFYIVDATNGQSPVIVSSAKTGPGLNAVDVAGNYAYVGNNSTENQLQIIDINDRSNPTIVKSFGLPGVSGNGAVGNAVFYYDSRVYIGTKTAAGPEFHIVDVSVPSSPAEAGNFEVGADVNGIYLAGNTAYLATSGDSKEILILNVANPSNIIQLGTFNAMADDDGKGVYLAGNTLYLGRTAGSGDFVIADASDYQSVNQLSSSDLGGVSVNGISTRDYLAFLATSDPNKELQIWNVSNSGSPALWSHFNFPQVASGLDYEDNLVYISLRSNDALRIITSGP